VISAVPGFLGHRTLKAVIEAGVNVVDIAFFPEDPFSLDELARATGVTAIVDCGVAPGLSNLLVGHAVRQLDETTRVTIYVGGLPSDPKPPYEYRAVFSPVDVIEEYVRPARLVVDGKIETRPALSEVELIDFEGIGRLEAFNTDGLRTVMKTIDCPNMIEKTLRYPGHADKVRLLRDTGFFSEEPIEIDGTEVRPIDVTTALLFPLWQLKAGEEDVTVLQVNVEGTKDGETVRHTYDLVDRFDRQTETTSMARTTGYTATMATRMLAAGMVDEAGVLAPESLADDPARVAFILEGLRQRGIDVRETVEE
ncbi:MAG: saccharopine dehydrogenase C-terminal domain-containing protein, partial [Candidatus Bipolaricaulia bacterium]